MKRLFLILFLSGTALSAQEIKPRYAIMDDYVRQLLIDDWDLHAKDSVLLERGYCLQYQLDFWASEIVYRVTQIERAEAHSAGPNGVMFRCPEGPKRATLHIHTANSCLGDEQCFPGGPYAYQCLASPTDYQSLDWSGNAFAMVQCSREAIVSYWPTGAKPPLPEVLRDSSIVKHGRTPPLSTGATRYRQLS